MSTELLAEDRVPPRAEGLDTLAEVRLNDTLVAATDNQNVTWKWDVRALLLSGTNTLAIRFTPPDAFLAEKGKINPLVAWNEYNGYKHRGWIRKAHSKFGWDWSPVLVSCGVWRPISLVAFTGDRLDDVRTEQVHGADGVVMVSVNVGLQTSRPGAASARIELTFADEPCAGAEISFGADVRHGFASLGGAEPRLWWPNGMGEQPLYTLAVRLLDSDGGEVDRRRRRVGLRTLELVRKPDAWGEKWRRRATPRSGSAFARCNRRSGCGSKRRTPIPGSRTTFRVSSPELHGTSWPRRRDR